MKAVPSKAKQTGEAVDQSPMEVHPAEGDLVYHTCIDKYVMPEDPWANAWRPTFDIPKSPKTSDHIEPVGQPNDKQRNKRLAFFEVGKKIHVADGGKVKQPDHFALPHAVSFAWPPFAIN